MTISAALRQLVRSRASFRCEFCGISETDCGGELTIDHFRPTVQDGSDDDGNLIYCCYRCNHYKADYWPVKLDDPLLWNPRQDSSDVHFLKLGDGKLYPLTEIGKYSLERLRLNRPALVAHRLREIKTSEDQQLLAQYRQLGDLEERLNEQHVALLEEHRRLLEQQRELLKLLLRLGS